MGAAVQARFLEIVGGSKTARAADGDVIVPFNGKKAFVEVKHAGSTTINQVRAVKYITLVVFSVPQTQWYVVPPHAVVELVSRKTRGQHTENPFESATLSTRDLAKFVVDEKNLKERTIDACKAGEQHPLRQVMRDVLSRCVQLAIESRELVKAALEANR
jgi:hypothetical protein